MIVNVTLSIEVNPKSKGGFDIDLIRKKRQDLYLTQQDVADALGVTRQAYAALEAGRTGNLRKMSMKKLCEILGINEEDLYTNTGRADDKIDIQDLRKEVLIALKKAIEES